MIEVKNKPTAFSLSEPELLELLRRMDATSQNRDARNRRKHVRHTHTSRETHIKVVQPAGGTTERLITVRDLSAGGASILYPGYLHNGTAVQIELRKRAGGRELVLGHVENCRHIHGVWHAIGLQFEEIIFPQLFLDQSVRSSSEDAVAVKVDISRLKGSILLIDDQMIDRSLFTHLLKGSGLRVTESGSAEEAIALVSHGMATEQAKTPQTGHPYDLIVCDLNLGDEAGEVLIKKLRDKGYCGPLLVMTAETTPNRLSAAQEAGGTGVIQKPYSADKLHAVIAAQLGERCNIVDDPLYSPLCADPQNRILVEKYVTQVRAMAAELRKCIGADNLPQVRAICQTLKGTGVGYGFSALTNVAASALTSLDASQSVAESVNELHRLDAICARLTAVEPPHLPGSRR